VAAIFAQNLIGGALKGYGQESVDAQVGEYSEALAQALGSEDPVAEMQGYEKGEYSDVIGALMKERRAKALEQEAYNREWGRKKKELMYEQDVKNSAHEDPRVRAAAQARMGGPAPAPVHGAGQQGAGYYNQQPGAAAPGAIASKATYGGPAAPPPPPPAPGGPVTFKKQEEVSAANAKEAFKVNQEKQDKLREKAAAMAKTSKAMGQLAAENTAHIEMAGNTTGGSGIGESAQTWLMGMGADLTGSEKWREQHTGRKAMATKNVDIFKAAKAKTGGLGGVSEKEVEMLISSGVNVNNPIEVNKAINAGLVAGAQKEADHAQFINENIDSMPADQIEKLINAHTMEQDVITINPKTGLAAVNPNYLPIKTWLSYKQRKEADHAAFINENIDSMPADQIEKLINAHTMEQDVITIDKKTGLAAVNPNYLPIKTWLKYKQRQAELTQKAERAQAMKRVGQ
jgi:hypothetical protein